jgi:hypothetical protein
MPSPAKMPTGLAFSRPLPRHGEVLEETSPCPLLGHRTRRGVEGDGSRGEQTEKTRGPGQRPRVNQSHRRLKADRQAKSEIDGRRQAVNHSSRSLASSDGVDHSSRSLTSIDGVNRSSRSLTSIDGVDRSSRSLTSIAGVDRSSRTSQMSPRSGGFSTRALIIS